MSGQWPRRGTEPVEAYLVGESRRFSRSLNPRPPRDDMKAHLTALIVAVLASSSVLPAETRAAPGPARPNVLFIIFDDWGWQHAGAYGCTWVKTPNFDRV